MSLETYYNLEGECHDAELEKKNYRFDRLRGLAEKAGFVDRSKKRAKHSYVYKHPTYVLDKGGGSKTDMVNLQPDTKTHSKAKPYQVTQVINFIRNAKPKNKA